jgi:hypothetical protein
MDLRAFFGVHKNNNTLTDVIEGIEYSSFNEKHTEIHNLIRQMLSALLVDTLKTNYNQNQNGGLAARANKEVEKKQSFCTEFSQLVNNILALLGSEFSKYLFFLFGIKQIIGKVIKQIYAVINYEDLLAKIRCIYNLISLRNLILLPEALKYFNESNTSREIKCLPSRVEVVDPVSFAAVNENSINDEDNLLYDSLLTDDVKERFFQDIFSNITEQIKSKSVVNFDIDKQTLIENLTALNSTLVLNEYFINNIDDLVLNLGSFNVGYDESFLKCFEILYKESFADIPRELWYCRKPYQDFVNNLKLESCNAYHANLLKYFKNIYTETLCSFKEITPEKDILKVEITNNMYETLVDITLNLFVNMAKNLALSQMTSFCFGKSTRIQFVQVFSAFLSCAPRLKNFSKSQINALHYFLLTGKTLQESRQILELDK